VKPWRTSAPTEEELVRLETLIQGTLDWINGRKGQIGCSELGTLLGLLDRTRKMLFEIYMGLKRPKELDKEDTYFMGPGKETYTRRQHRVYFMCLINIVFFSFLFFWLLSLSERPLS